MDEFQVIGRHAFLDRYGLSVAVRYFVRHPVTDTLCDSKAIMGAAYGYQFPNEGPLCAADFSGGEATVATQLKSLGFDVVIDPSSQHDLAPGAEQHRRDWSPQECALLVADYLQMLTLELTGQRYNKAARRRELLPLLNGRSESAIEFKRRNVSAILVSLGYPSVRGYLPADNAQGGPLIEVIAAQVSQLPLLDQAAEAAVDRPATAPQVADFGTVLTAAPKRGLKAQEPASLYLRQALRRDYLEREARNHTLGTAGEKFVVDFERWRLLRQGLGQLADKVTHSAQTHGDGLGYDVLSFEPDGTERYIEVKTTAFGESTPFYISANELRFARSQPARFKLCRVFDFRATPRLFELSGPVENHVFLDPTTYRASLQ